MPYPTVAAPLSYADENIEITINTYREYDSYIYVADVKIASLEYLKTAFAKGKYGKNVTQKTSTMAANNNAILAINGDYYGSQERGYVLRNGMLYREKSSGNHEDLVIWADGSFSVIDENSVSAAALADSDAYQLFCFGPALVLNGQVNVESDAEVAKATKSGNPRTCIGIVEPGHYLFIVSDGRTDESHGLSLYELACFASDLGAEVCYNLDGGGSSTMYFNGEVINKPVAYGHTIVERNVSDIIYIGY